MPIDQAKLNDATREAIQRLCSLLPTSVGPVGEKSREEGLEIEITNPWLPDRTLRILTDNQELTVCFANSHYHIGDYLSNCTEAELIEDMILGVAAIIGGNSCAYSCYAGDQVLGGGMGDGSVTETQFEFWSRADRFEVRSWDGSEDKVVPHRPSK